MTATTRLHGASSYRDTVPFRHQAAIGLAFASAVILGWLALHVLGVFELDLRAHPLLIAAVPLLIVLQCWLDVGLFIVAHDAMHGSLVPFWPRVNRAVGQLCLFLYAGFSFDRLITKHHDHHRHAGTDRDPDFHVGAPTRFWPWYGTFMLRYLGVREIGTIAVLLLIYLLVLNARLENVLLFWAAPALLSSLQLFGFGTYLPHRHSDDHFVDRHNARSNEFGPVLSFLTCLHFGGYHHEHHLSPRTPWWGLPGVRGAR